MIFSNLDIKSDLDRELALLESQESNFVISPSSLREKIIESKANGGVQSGKSLPWAKADDIIKLRPGELSVWGGINGHGKSLILGQVINGLLKTQKALIVSLELFPHQTVERMIDQLAGCNSGTRFIDSALLALEGSLWLYDQVNTVHSQKIIALIHFAAKRLCVDHIVIDSMTKCGLSSDFDAEKKFLDSLQWAAKNLGVHIHLVCHIRKGESEDKIPNKFDIKGSGAITDIPDNIFIHWRNKRKEIIKKEMEIGKITGRDYSLNSQDEKILSMPDALLNVEKNRHGGEEGRMGLFFHKESGQYTSIEGRVMADPLNIQVN